MSYLIKRPLLHSNFELPTREELLDLKVGDFVKLIFTDKKGKNGERMWVILTKINKEGDCYHGILDNKAVRLRIKLETKITFHPLDIIDCLTK